ncbi:MAG: c-type cytochrome domain-containing protein [Bdellovibrionales bacterium]
MKDSWRLLTAFGTLSIILVSFNNCNSTHTELGSSVGLSEVAVQNVMRDEFLKPDGYSGFLVTNCSSCHVSGGGGSGHFGSSDIDRAFRDFYAVGYEYVSLRAVSSHGTGGPHNQEIIDRLKAEWEQILLTAQGSISVSDIEFDIITNPQNPDSRNLNWSFEDYNPEYSDINGVQGLSASSRIEDMVELGQVWGVAVSSPELRLDPSADSDLLITGVDYYMNGNSLGKNTLYKSSVCLKPGESKSLGGTTSVITDYIVQGGEFFSIALLEVEETVCPETASFPTISFKLENIPNSKKSIPAATNGWEIEEYFEGSIPKLNDGNVDISAVQNTTYPIQKIIVELDRKPESINLPVQFRLSFSGTASRRSLVLIPEMDNDNALRKTVNWDYEVNGSLFEIAAGETRKEIIVMINDDDLYENEENDSGTVTKNFESIRIAFAEDSISNAEAIDSRTGSKVNRYEIRLLDDDIKHVGLPSQSFAWLMENRIAIEEGAGDADTNGCIRCHNSFRAEGGYDISDYRLMVGKGVIVPGNAEGSELYDRLISDSDPTGQERNYKMPFSVGGLSPAGIRDFKRWLDSGAKNN